MYIRKILVGILIVGIVLGFYFMYSITQTIFKPNTTFQNKIAYVYITSDATFKEVKAELAPLVTDINSFETVATKKGYTNRVKGGLYIIKKDMNSNDIVNVLLGQSVPVNVTIPASEDISLISKQISLQIEASAEALQKVMQDTIFLKEHQRTFSELYKPGTYTMIWSMSAENFRDFMLEKSQSSNQ